MKKEICDFLSTVFLFQGVKKEIIADIIKKITPEIKLYARREKIYTPSDYEHKVGFIIRGECTVERIKGDGNSVPLNTLKTGQSFGIMTILSCDDEFPTRVIAKRETEILFLSKDDTLNLINGYPRIAMNVISFLSKKICFLNSKIATFSSASVEEKLSNYILSEYKRLGSDTIPFNCQKSAAAISAGRASLYRAINTLSENGTIKLENKKIYIIDPKGLERNSK